MKKAILIFFAILITTATACAQNLQGGNDAMSEAKMYITVTNAEGVVTKLSATMEDNSATRELVEKLRKSDVTLTMQPYGGFEVYGTFDFSLPRQDVSVTTKCGDLMLAWGNTLSLNYDRNSYSFTPIGFLDEVKTGALDSAGLKKVLGSGNVSAVLSVE